MIIRFWLALATALTLCPVVSGQGAALSEAASLKWEQQSIVELERALPDLDAVQAFAREVLAKEPGRDKDDLETDPPGLAGYKFADLKGDGGLELVCLLDYTGRMRPTELMVVENQNGHFHTAFLNAGEGGLGIGEVKRVVRELKGDGRSEILIPYALEPFTSPVVPTAHLEHVYVYQAGVLVQSDSAFLDYYKREVLPHLREQLRSITEQKPALDASNLDRKIHQKSIDAKQKEIDAVLRMFPNH
jgi:hypothetical protein